MDRMAPIGGRGNVYTPFGSSTFGSFEGMTLISGPEMLVRLYHIFVTTVLVTKVLVIDLLVTEVPVTAVLVTDQLVTSLLVTSLLVTSLLVTAQKIRISRSKAQKSTVEFKNGEKFKFFE